jgi:hypothetical protein
MRRGVLLGVAILAGVIGFGCSNRQNLPTPPQPPDLTGRTLPKPPGSGDFAWGSFPYPLSLSDAEAVLRRTGLFAFGGMPPKRQVQAFNVLFERSDAASRFRSLARAESPAAKLYALTGLLLLDRASAQSVRVSLSGDEQHILVMESDMASERPVREVADLLERRNLGRAFRRERDETDQYFAKAANVSRFLGLQPRSQ